MSLEPLPPSTGTPVHIPFMLNRSPYYSTVLADPASITVDAILERAFGALGGRIDRVGCAPFALRLRWITDKRMAFSPGQSVDQYMHWKEWYESKGHHLASEPIVIDSALQEKVRDMITIDALGLVQLFVVAPPDSYVGRMPSNIEEERKLNPFFYTHDPVTGRPMRPSRIKYEDDSKLTRMAALYEPAFAHAASALRNVQDEAMLSDGQGCHDGAVDSADVAVDFVPRLRDALRNLKAGCPEAGSPQVEALGALFQQLFDDPTLRVIVKSSGVDGDPCIKLDIKGRCPTAYGIPALYVVGKDMLISPSAADGAPEAEVPQGMITYRDAVVVSEYDPVFETTCCPCLVIGTSGTTIQLYAAYLSDGIYRSHICEFALDSSLTRASDEDAIKFQVVRSTARMLRESYGMVHTGAVLSTGTRPHLLPNLTLSAVKSGPLPFHLDLVDGIAKGAYTNVFTGELKLPRPSPARENDDGSEPEPKPLRVHVKFVEAYGVTAHRLLAGHKGADGEPRPLAPQLHWVGEVAPGLMMIVMESLSSDVRTLWSYLPRLDEDLDSEEMRYMKRYRPPPPEPVSWHELEDVRTAVELLHAHGLVHGDVRPENVMLMRPQPVSTSTDGAPSEEGADSEEGSNSYGADSESELDGESPSSDYPTGTRAYLIDFDWAGREGEVCYPKLNPNVEWPGPAAELSGQPITKLHDAYMLERLLDLFGSKGQSEHENDGESEDGHEGDGNSDE